MEQTHYTTERLCLDGLSSGDCDFIFELVNTSDWIRFIGERNVKTTRDAKAYIQRIKENKAISYWVVKLKDKKVPIGIITFIKRDYLEHHDLGFAFLPGYVGMGYAEEAAYAVLRDLIRNDSAILATTVKDNTASIKLLKRLGFVFEKDISHAGTELHLYKITPDKMELDELVRGFFQVFNNKNGCTPDWQVIHRVCLNDALMVKKTEDGEIVYSLDSFIEPRKQLLSDGTLVDFEEHELIDTTDIAGDMAERFSQYSKSGRLNGNYFKEQGEKLFRFVKTAQGWKIFSVIWKDDTS